MLKIRKNSLSSIYERFSAAVVLALFFAALTANAQSLPALTDLVRTSAATVAPGATVTFRATYAEGSAPVAFFMVNVTDPTGAPRNFATIGAPSSGGTVALGVDASWVNGTYTVNYIAFKDSGDRYIYYRRNGAVDAVPGVAGTPTSHAVNLAGQDFQVSGGVAPPSPAAIVTQPLSVTANAGQSVTLSLSASGNPIPTIQWSKDGKAIAGATNSSLTFASVFGGDAGSYTATVSNVYNGTSYNLTTSPAVLTVMTTPPSITTPPVGQTVMSGAKVALAVNVSGSGPVDYQWYLNGMDVVGATNQALVINEARESDAGVYTVAVSNWITKVTGVAAGLHHTMFVKADGSLWSVGANDSGQLGDGTTIDRGLPVKVAAGVSSVAAGYAFTMFVKTDGSLWAMGANGSGQFGDGSLDPKVAPFQVSTGVKNVAVGGSWASGSYFSLVLKKDGTLWSAGSNRAGQLGDGTFTDRSIPVQIAVDVKTASAFQASRSWYGLHAMYIKSDGSLWAMGFNVSGQLGDGSNASRSSPVKVADNVTQVSVGSTHTAFVKADGSLWTVGANESGQLGDGTTSDRSLPVQIASGVETVSSGSSYTMFVKTDGSLWAMGTNNLGQLGDGTKTRRLAPVRVAGNVSMVAAGEENTFWLKRDGTVWAVGANGYGELGDGSRSAKQSPAFVLGGVQSSPATVVVNTELSIIDQPSSMAVAAGMPVTLGVSVSGSPQGQFQWKKNGVNITGATNASFVIASAGLGDAGIYTVVVTNSVSSITSNEAVLTVGPAAPAAITAQPANLTVNLGQTATLSVAVSGLPVPTVQWFKNGTAVPGATGSVYIIPSVSQADSATYTATVQNVFYGTSYSLTTSPAVLTVVAVPVFTTQPLSRTVLAGTQVTFSAAVQGLAATTFQWRRNGAAIPGATGSSYSLISPVTSDSGTYTVVATNSEGSTTSNPAELVVNAVVPPTISGAPANVTIPNGERTQLKVTATGTGMLTYQWYQGQSGTTTSPVAGATGATLTTAALTATSSYWVRVTDGNGAVTNSPTATVTVATSSPLVVTQQTVGSGYAPGGGVIVTNTITYSGTAPSRIDWSTLLPAGWKYLGSGGSEGAARPTYKNTDLIEWSWTTVPPSPIEFTYTVGVPAGTSGDQVIASLVSSQAAGASYQTMAKPDPLVFRNASMHSADANGDGRISLQELTRVIELYNYRSGNVRTGQYKPQAGTEDGFAPGPVPPAGYALIPAGTYTMGSVVESIEGTNKGEDLANSATPHLVTLSAFYLAKTETTFADWVAVRDWGLDPARGTGAYDFSATLGDGKGATHPVHSVSWFEVVKWCNAKSEREGLTPVYYTNDAQTTVYRTGNVNVTNVQVNWAANGYRLPTEAEWEYAARGGVSGKRFSWGDTITHAQANYTSLSGYAYDLSATRGYHPTYGTGSLPYTAPVGVFGSNAYGLADMMGNVWEWCWDWYGSYGSAAVTDPRGSASGSIRVSRGGGWNVDAAGVRSASRISSGNLIGPDARTYQIGFRTARSAAP